MTRIRLLPALTVNRIAAGEVVERPAAAVKELVENALDAGADRIAVTLEGGGIERIEVTDTGEGMNEEDLALAVLRHATSKLTDQNLTRIATLGFRGEALPSIGAAGRLMITSRPPGATHASCISVEGGSVSPVSPCAGPPGTRVVVRDLFFATPARRKFLKAPRTEADHAEAATRRLALAAPAVAFRLEIDGRVIFDLPSQDRAARVAALLGTETAGALLPIEAERGAYRLAGFVCAPTVHRATAAAQAFTVNNRPVADPVLKSAVRVAYRDVIVAARHAVVALWLDLPHEDLDVNVHPTKNELRFRDAAAIRSLLIGGIGRVLAGGAGLPGAASGLGLMHRPQLRLSHPRPGRYSHAWASAQAGTLTFGPATPGAMNSPGLTGGAADLVWDGATGGSAPQALALASGQCPMPDLPHGMEGQDDPWENAGRRADQAVPAASWSIPDAMAERQLPLAGAPSARSLPAVAPCPEHPLGAAVAQVLDTYIIAVAADGALVLVDQHAAHERLTHEAIRAQVMMGGVRSQPLLLPAVVDLPHGDAARLLARAEDLRQLGLEIEGFGPGAVLVRALPALLGAPEPAPLLRDLADELAEMEETTTLAARIDAVVARLACHGSIRAGRRLSQPEMNALLRQMEATPRAATCSHGRPTVLRLTQAEIETLFGRR